MEMDGSNPENGQAPQLEGTAKAIRDLDLLLRALLTALPATKPWQRQLRGHLQEADRLLQVLRMTVAMERSDTEIHQAARELLTPLRAAGVYVGAGRADAATKQAVQLALSLAQITVGGLVALSESE